MKAKQNLQNAVSYSIGHWYLGGPAFSIALFFFVHFRLGLRQIVGSLTFPDLCFLASGILLLLILLATFFVRLTDYQRPLVIVSSLGGILCSVCIVLPAILGIHLMAFYLLGAILFSIFLITNWLLWFQLISNLPIMVAAAVITISVSIASLFTWYLVGLDSYRLLWGLLLLIGLAALTLSHAIREQGELFSNRPANETTTQRTKFPIGLLAVTFCFSLAFMFTTSLTGLEAFHSDFNWELAVFALLLLLAMLLLSERISITVLFSIAAPVTIAGILLSLMPEMATILPSSLFGLGFFIYLVFVVTLSCGIMQARRGDPSRLASLLILSFFCGLFMGRLLHVAAGLLSVAQADYSLTVLTMGIIVLLVICTTLCLRVTYRLAGPQSHDSRFEFAGLPKSGLMSSEQAKETFDLSDRELEVLKLLLGGKSATQIAREMVIAQGTAKAHIGNVYRKMDVHDRRELFSLISPDDV